MELNGFEKKILDALDGSKGAIKHCGKHAINHLEKAWDIRLVDKEMSFFRGITAEEEAASCLFYSLKTLRYRNADRLLFKEHTYKLGLFPFLEAVGGFFSNKSFPFETFSLRHTECEGRKAVELTLKLRGKEINVTPVPPLHFSITNSDTGDVITFEKNFAAAIKGEGYRSARDYIRYFAKRRSEILYANEAGRPQIEGDIEGFLIDQKRKVIVVLTLVLLSDPWHKKYGGSSFVQQALDSFLVLQERIKREQITPLPQ